MAKTLLRDLVARGLDPERARLFVIDGAKALRSAIRKIFGDLGGMDVHAASCTLAVVSQTGKRLKDFPVETHGQALVEAIRMIPGHKHLVFEEGLQSAWLYETLSPHVDELVVAGITQSRGPKSDKRDAYGLAESG